MKTLFIEAKAKDKINVEKIKISGKVGLVSTIQYLDQLKNIKKYLKNSVIGGQILGCDARNAIKIKNKVDKFLYIGTGEFHPIEVALQTNKPVYIFNPISHKLLRLNENEIKSYKLRLKGKLTKFYLAVRIGILVSTKYGQYNMEEAVRLKNKIKEMKKEPYVFLFDTLNKDQLENFPDIQFWVNTACPRIDNKNIINARDLKI